VAGKGGIILPEADAIQQAQAEAAKWDSKLLSWCPQCGAFEVPIGTQCQRRPHPMNAQIPTIWAPCPICSSPNINVFHNANGVLVPKGQIVTVNVPPSVHAPDCASLEAAGKNAAKQCVETWPGVAAFHVERVDTAGPSGGKLAGLVISAVDADFAVLETVHGEDKRSSTLEVMIDGADTNDLNARVLAYGRGLESERPIFYGGWENCKRLWLEAHK
jgi:hypothetical protein